MKTSELTEAALDWAVAKCEGQPVDDVYKLVQGGWIAFDEFDNPSWDGYPYSTDWAQGGPIIEREFIELTTTNRSNDELWEALGRGFGEDCPTGHGTTPLIAAMRCYVASKLGDEVEIPQQLIT